MHPRPFPPPPPIPPPSFAGTSAMSQRRRIPFSGRVPGVGFRAPPVHLAADLDLAGTVQNLADGDVELVVEGAPKEIDTLLDRLREHFDRCIRTMSQDVSPATGLFGQWGEGIRILG